MANVDFVRAVADALNERAAEGYLELLPEDFEADWSRSKVPVAGGSTGVEAEVEAFLRTFEEVWERARWDVRSIEELSPEHVLLVYDGHFRGRGSGIELKAHAVQLWTFDGDVPVRAAIFQSEEDARAAAVQSSG